jgi:hypothetical protein
MTTDQTKRSRGRPRPPETIARDEAILAHLRTNGAQSRNQIADSFGLPYTIVYLALDRLRREGKVRTCADTAGPRTLWSAEVDAPCP